MKFSVQLYTLRDEIQNADGLLAIFPKLRQLGFEGVELCGYHGMDPITIKTALDNAGLVATGCHTSINNFYPDKIDETIAFHKALGMSYIGVGGAGHGTVEEATKTSLIFEWANKYGAAHGMKFFYHTHSSEFRPYEEGGELCPIDILMKGAYIEVDTLWSYTAGIDTRAFLLAHKDRVPFVHIKDGIAATHSPCALGEGENDLITVINTVKEMGHEWIVLENDSPRPTPLEDVARSIKFLKEHA